MCGQQRRAALNTLRIASPPIESYRIAPRENEWNHEQPPQLPAPTQRKPKTLVEQPKSPALPSTPCDELHRCDGDRSNDVIHARGYTAHVQILSPGSAQNLRAATFRATHNVLGRAR